MPTKYLCSECGTMCDEEKCDCRETEITKNDKMKTGIELIAQERKEQIEKHGRSSQSDVEFNKENQLLSAIMMIVSDIAFKRNGITEMPKEAFEDLLPEGWGREICWKMLGKPEIEQLQIIGAFAAAEIDRLHLLNKTPEPAPESPEQ